MAQPTKRSLTEVFHDFAKKVADLAGSPWTFMGALAVIVIWAVTGPLFHFSDTWQLVVNTGTTIVTFLVVILIQDTQNRDSRDMQLRLDEMRATTVSIEELSDGELARIRRELETRLHSLDETQAKRA